MADYSLPALRDRLTWQAITRTVNAYGENVDDFPSDNSGTKLWGSVRPLSGREFNFARQAGDETTHEVTVRWRKDMDTAGRFLWHRGERRVILHPEAMTVQGGSRQRAIVFRCKESNPES